MTLTLSIVAPANNESESLAEFAQQILSLDLGLSIALSELIIVDDGSTDITWEIISQLSHQHHQIRGVKLSRNFGKEPAIMAGLAVATGDAVVVMDCDLQHPPEVVPLMVSMWQQGFEIVHGKKSARQRESRVSRIGATTYYRILKTSTGLDLRNASDFKLLDRKVVNALNVFEETETFFRALNEWIGFKSVVVEFNPKDRRGGISSWSNLKKIRLAVVSVISFSSTPIKLVGVSAALMSMIAVFVSVNVVINVITGNAIEGFATVILLQVLSTALLMVTQVVVALYIYRIFGEVKRRPRYLVQEMLRCGTQTEINNESE